MHTEFRTRPLAVLAVVACTLPTAIETTGSPTTDPAPCIWDSDTLADELRGIPDAFTLITGRWHRHDLAYYRARIDRLPAHLEAHPDDFAAFDDLAVAYERLQLRSEAVAVMARKKAAIDRFAPEDTTPLYRYHANLGTFFAHMGRFDEALHELERAVAINPDAHFGRERFQIDLIRYIQAAREEPGLWTEHDFLTWSGYRFEDAGWQSHITRQGFTADEPAYVEGGDPVAWQAAWTAVAGMLRFGGIEGAELYRELGDLATAQRHLHLAWYAYGVAIEKGHPAAERLAASRASIVEHQRDARRHNGGPAQIPDDAAFTAARDNADRWLAAFQRHEREALEAGRDPGDPEVLKELLEAADQRVPPLPEQAGSVPTGPRPGGRARGPAKDGTTPAQSAPGEAAPKPSSGRAASSAANRIRSQEHVGRGAAIVEACSETSCSA